MTDVIRRAKYEVDTSAVTKATTDLNAMANASEGVRLSSIKQEKATTDLSSAVEKLQRRLDSQYRAMQQHVANEKLLDSAVAQGAISIMRKNELMALSAERINTAATATGNFTKSSGLARHELVNLGRQVQDVGTMFAMGASPMQVFASQAAQVGDIFASTSGTLRGFAGQLASVITPLTVGVAGVAVAVGGAAYAAHSLSGEQRELQRQLTGTGRDAGVTADQIDRMATSLSKAQSLSTSEARRTIGSLANRGSIDPAYLERIAAVSKDLAATLGIEMQAATDLLGNAFSDPIRGAEALNERLGGLTSSTRSYIREQVAAGNEQAAYQRILDTFTPRLGKASELTSGWAQAWERVGAAASRARDATARALDRPITPDFAQQAQDRLDALEAASRGQVVDRTSGRVLGGRSAFGITQDELQAELDGRKRVTAELELQRLAVNAIRTGQEALNAATESQARTQFDIARSRRQVETGAATAVQMGLPERLQIEGVRRLADSYRELYRAKEEALQNQGRENGNEIYRRAVDDMRSAQRALRDTVTDSSGMFARDGQLLLENNTILERRRTLIQQNADRVQVERQGITAVTQAEQAAAAAARVRQQAREQGAAAGGQELVNAQATAAAETTRLAINHQLSQAAKERILSAQLQVESIRAETAAMGGSVGAVERARLEQQLLADAKREYGRLGLSVPPAEIEAYRRLAAAMGEARQAQAELRAQRDIAFERQVIGLSDGEAQIARNLRQIYGDEGWRREMGGTLASQARFNEQLKLTNDLGKAFGADVLSGFREGKSIIDAMTSAATRLSNRFADMGMEKFVQAVAAGQNPFQAVFGAGAGSFGNAGLLSLSASRLGNIVQTSVADGAADGLKAAFKGVEGTSAGGGGFGNQLGGGLLLGSSMLGAYGAGKQGGVGGVVSGTIGGAVAGATALPALLGVTGPVGAIIGGALSLASAIPSKSRGNKEIANDRDRRREVFRAHLAAN